MACSFALRGAAQPFAARYRYTPGGLISRVEQRTPESVRDCPFSVANPWDPIPPPDSDACARRWRTDYTYDALGQLHQAIFVPHNGNHSQGQYFSTGLIHYDRQGNINDLTRWAPTSASPHGQWVDNLTYQYTPGTNRLEEVTDSMGDVDGWDARPTTFRYDHNGAMTEQVEALAGGQERRLRVTRLDERGLPERLEQLTYASPGPTANQEYDYTAYRYDAAGQRILKRSWTAAPVSDGLPGQGPEPVYAVERYVRDGARLVGAFDGEGTLLWWTLGGAAGLEGRIVRESSGTIIDGPKAMQTSQMRLAAEADTLLIGALTALGVTDAEAVALHASWAVQQAVQDAVAGSVAEAEAGAALGITDAGGRAQYGATHEAVVEALRLALLAEGYDPFAADTLSRQAGTEASVGLAQVVGASVGEAKDGDEGMSPIPTPLVYRRLYYLTDHLGSVRAVVRPNGTVVPSLRLDRLQKRRWGQNLDVSKRMEHEQILVTRHDDRARS